MVAPAIARALFRLHERALHRPTFAMLAELERTQWLGAAELEALRSRRLAALLHNALDHSPWHAERIRAAGLEQAVRERAVTAADLRRLPTMDKTDARTHRERIVWRGCPGGVYQSNTGGSSGEPLIFYYGRERQASDPAGRMRARRWWGIEPGSREVLLWGAPVELSRTDRIKRVRDRLLNQLLLNAFEMSAGSMDGYLDAIEAFRPECLYGYASSLALLAAHALERGRRLRLPRLRAVFTTGEPLYPHQRTLIAEAFGVPVASEFGSRDIGFTAHESPEGEMLVLSENLIVEVLDADGAPAPPGEAGEAVITALCSSAQPFIRYRTGDVVRAGTAPARCGRSLEVLSEVLGRTTDFVVRSDGTVMHALALIYVLREQPGVAAFRIVQEDLRKVTVQVVPGTGWSDLGRQAIRRGLQQRLGEVDIEVRTMDAIPADPSGKFRYVVSRVPLPGSLHEALHADRHQGCA